MANHRWGALSRIVNERIESGAHDGLLIDTGNGLVRLTARQARDAVCVSGRDTTLRDAIWREAIHAAQREGPTNETGRLFALWLAEPWMRRTLSMISIRLRVSPEDLEAEMATTLLEGLTTIDADLPGAGEKVLKSVSSRAWSEARSGSRETPVKDLFVFAPPKGLNRFPGGRWESKTAPPGHIGERSAPIRLAATPSQIEGVRLGVLAQRLGLTDILDCARRPTKRRLIGTLSLRSTGAPR